MSLSMDSPTQTAITDLQDWFKQSPVLKLLTVCRDVCSDAVNGDTTSYEQFVNLMERSGMSKELRYLAKSLEVVDIVMKRDFGGKRVVRDQLSKENQLVSVALPDKKQEHGGKHGTGVDDFDGANQLDSAAQSASNEDNGAAAVDLGPASGLKPASPAS